METYKKFIERKKKEFKDMQRPIWIKDISGKGRQRFKREAWVFMPQHNLNEKVFLFERIKRVKIEGEVAYPEEAKIGNLLYRIGYYIVGKKGNRKGKWTWGQFCPFIPPDDLKKLLKKAKKERVIKGKI